VFLIEDQTLFSVYSFAGERSKPADYKTWK